MGRKVARALEAIWQEFRAEKWPEQPNIRSPGREANRRNLSIDFFVFLPQTLVKTLAKTMVKNLAKNLTQNLRKTTEK